MSRKETEIIEDEDEQFKGVNGEGEGYRGLAEGDRAIIEVSGRKKTKFWRKYNGQECFIVSRHKTSAIVEVPAYKELIVCHLINLRPSGSGRSR